MPIDAAPRPHDHIDVVVGRGIQEGPGAGDPGRDPVLIDEVSLAEVGDRTGDASIVEIETGAAVVRPRVLPSEGRESLECIHSGDDLTAVAGVVVGDVEGG